VLAVVLAAVLMVDQEVLMADLEDLAVLMADLEVQEAHMAVLVVRAVVRAVLEVLMVVLRGVRQEGIPQVEHLRGAHHIQGQHLIHCSQ
jgi:hypothetical protein